MLPLDEPYSHALFEQLLMSAVIAEPDEFRSGMIFPKTKSAGQGPLRFLSHEKTAPEG